MFSETIDPIPQKLTQSARKSPFHSYSSLCGYHRVSLTVQSKHIKRATKWDVTCSTYLAGRVWAKRYPRQDSIWKVKATGMTGMAGEG